MNILIKISDKDLPAFLAYLGLGTLFAIRNGTVPAETGIGTIGRPRVWKFIPKQAKVPKRIVRAYQTADELSSIKGLIPDEFDTEVGNLMDDLEKELAKMKDPYWEIDWEVEPASPPPRRPKVQRGKHTSLRKQKHSRRE